MSLSPILSYSSDHHLIAPNTTFTMDSPRSDMITSNGKAASSNQNPGAIGFRPTNGGIVKVQPPRKEDLQPSYAQVLEGNETHAETHGWYGSMSTIALHPFCD